jgi:hypothetical protein
MTVKENGSIWIVLRSRRSLMAPGIAMTVREGLRKKNRNNSPYGLGKRPLAISNLRENMIAVVGIPSFKMKEGEKMFRKTHLGDCTVGGVMLV